MHPTSVFCSKHQTNLLVGGRVLSVNGLPKLSATVVSLISWQYACYQMYPSLVFYCLISDTEYFTLSNAIMPDDFTCQWLGIAS